MTTQESPRASHRPTGRSPGSPIQLHRVTNPETSSWLGARPRPRWYPPPTPSFAIRRPHLEQILDSQPDLGVVLVRGPVGAGKTTLVAQWVREQGQPWAWLSVDATHDAARLLGDLVAAAESLHSHPEAGGANGRSTSRNHLDLASLDEAFAVATRRLGHGVILVVDDIHHLRDLGARHLLRRLVEHRIEGVRLVLISRSKPRLGLARARLRGDLVEVGPPELRFRSDEVVDLVAGWTGRTPDVADVEQRTLGWAAGLRLAQLAASERKAASPGLLATDDLVDSYVSEELIEGCGPQVQSFLEVTCWLPVLTAELCNAVNAVTGSCWDCRFDWEALPLVPVASHPGSYRYPPILVPALQEEYCRRDPRRAAQARRDAAGAARQAGELTTSLRLYLQAGATDEAASVCRALAAENEAALRAVDELLQDLPDFTPAGAEWLAWRVRAAVAAGRISEARHLLERSEPAGSMGQAASEDHLLALGAVAEHVGDVAALLECADRLLVANEGSGPSSSVSVRAYGWRVRALVWSGDAAAARGELQVLDHRAGEAVGEPPSDLSLARAWVAWVDGDVARVTKITAAVRGETEAGRKGAAELAFLSGSAHRERNHMAKAVAALEEACATAASSSHQVVGALAASELARCHRAAGASMKALELVVSSRARSANLPPLVETHIRSTEVRVRLDHGDIAGAQAALRDSPAGADTSLLETRLALHGAPGDARGMLAGVDARTPRQVVEKLLLQAQLPEGETEAVSGSLVEAIAVGRSLGLIRTYLDEGPLMSRRFVELASEVGDRDVGRIAALACEELAQAPARPPGVPVAQLTARELAVLHMLPLRMSNREMAAQLYISINTLKTHVRAIYRKLDVAHRSEAVRRAKALQLV